MKQVDVLQAKYATFLLENEKILDVIELYPTYHLIMCILYCIGCKGCEILNQ